MKIRTVLLCSLLLSSLFMTGCQDMRKSRYARANQALPAHIQQKMAAMDMPKNSPIMIRIFKEESTLEVWKQQRNGKYGLIAEYEICKWSGKLGPKYLEGDRQAPEGFYMVSPAQMNPNSKYYLSFNIGFPNAYDRVNGRSGHHLMVHGACSSSGCYSMTDRSMAQIYAFGRDSFIGGQRQFQVHAFPFHMTKQNMSRYRKDPNYPFWTMLKQGYDLFEADRIPPEVDVCEKRYVFNMAKTYNAAFSPAETCPSGGQASPLQTAFTPAGKNDGEAFPVDHSVSGKTLSPSIAGFEEAGLIADWSRRRARGDKVASRPPSLSKAAVELAGAPDIVVPPVKFMAKPVPVPAVTREITASTQRHDG